MAFRSSLARHSVPQLVVLSVDIFVIFVVFLNYIRPAAT